MPDARNGLACIASGDWQAVPPIEIGELLNQLIPSLEAHGMSVVPGSVHDSGLTVEMPAGWMIDIAFRHRAELPDDPVSSDQHPVFPEAAGFNF